MSDKIQKLRQEIDRIDEEILSLLLQRLDIADQIGALKTELNLAVEDQEREAAIMNRLSATSTAPHIREQIGAIYESILQAAREVQQQKP